MALGLGSNLKYVRWSIAAYFIWFAFYKEMPTFITVALIVLLWGK
jgi:hypothetical protein